MKKSILHSIIYTLLFLSISEGNILLGQEKASSEKVFVHIDRDIYIAGENVFYSVNIFEADENKKSKVCYLLLRDGKHNYNMLHLKTDSGKCFGSFYLSDTLRTGYYELVGYTNYMRNFSEDGYFRKNILVINRFDGKLNNLASSNAVNPIQPEFNKGPIQLYLRKDSFKVREKVHLEILPNDNFLNIFNSNVSITIKELNPNLLYNQVIDGNSPKEVTSSTGNILYPKEDQGLFLSGLLLNKNATPLPNECLFLSTADSVPNLQYTFTDDKGWFHFLINDYYYGKKIIINTREIIENGYSILLDDKFKLEGNYKSPELNISPELKKYISQSQTLVKIQKSYAIKNLGEEVSKTKTIIPYVFKENGLVIRPSAFAFLNNLTEISENLLPDMKIRTENNINYPILFNTSSKQFFQDRAKIFLNGVPMYNLNPIMSWSTAQIAKIELCRLLRVKGEISFPGIVSIISAQKTDPSTYIPNAFLYRVNEFAELTYFDPPRYNEKSIHDPVPDFRQLLYWNPSLNLTNKKSIEFYTSDWSGTYIIEIVGTNKAGESFKVLSKLTVYE